MRIQLYQNDDQNGSLCVHMWNWRNDGDLPMKLQSKFKLLSYKSDDNTWLSSDNPMTHIRTTDTWEISANAKKWNGFEDFISLADLNRYMSPDKTIQMEIEIKRVDPVGPGECSCNGSSNGTSNGIS